VRELYEEKINWATFMISPAILEQLFSPNNEVCLKKNILKLRPTQFPVGMMEVDEKIVAVKKFSKK
ncbi:MAG: hypothetical protein ACJ76H_16135, partial [Bacteriovoracaceae bacterium]